MEEILKKDQLLYNVLYVVFRRKVRLTLLGGFSFALIVFFTLLITPTFKATTKILVRSNPQQQLILFKNLATPGKESAAINPGRNLIQILTGRQMAREVVERFKLDERTRTKEDVSEGSRSQIKEALFNTINSMAASIKDIIGVEDNPEKYFSAAVEHLIEKAEDIQPEEESNVINLTIWEETPRLASDIANFMAQRLAERSAELEQGNAQQAYDFTSKHVKEAERSLKVSEDTLFKFRKRHGVINFGDQKRERLKDLLVVESQHRAIEVKLGEAQAKLGEMRKTIVVQRDLLSRAPVITGNPVIKELVRSLNKQEVQLAGVLETFTESSRNVKSLKAQTLKSRQKVEKEVKALLGSGSAILQSIHPDLASEYIRLLVNMAGLTAKREILEQQIDGLREEAFSMAELEKELKSLNTLRGASEKIYTSLLGKASQLEIQKAFQVIGYDLKIIDKANVPEDASPDRPQWSFLLPLGFISSFLLSFGLIFFVEYWDESFKSPRDVEQKLDLDVLCTVPDMCK